MFTLDPAVYSGYEFSHVQTVGGKVTNSRTVIFSFSNADGSKGFKSESITSLNPDPFGTEYITEDVTVSFNGSTIKKNGVTTSEYTLEDIVSLDLSGLDLSIIKNKLTEVSFDDGSFSCVIPGVYAGAVIGSTSGISSVSVEIKLSDDMTKIVEVSLSYDRNGTVTTVNLVLE